MLPFCGYNMADYWGHWLSFASRTAPALLPHIYFVNWFRKGDDGRFLWPGYGENSRVLKWIIERVEGTADAVESPIGRLPGPSSLDVSGLPLAPGAVNELLSVDPREWQTEVGRIREHFARFGDRVPAPLVRAVDELEGRLLAAAAR